MTDSKHTKGPWRTFNGTDIFPDDDDQEGQRHIADCDLAGSIGGDEQRANARLIAAAPDLLEALKALSAAVFAPNDARSPELPAAMEMTISAIAKAGG